eukprot:5581326-Prymnesium_polylepis.1
MRAIYNLFPYGGSISYNPYGVRTFGCENAGAPPASRRLVGRVRRQQSRKVTGRVVVVRLRKPGINPIKA